MLESQVRKPYDCMEGKWELCRSGSRGQVVFEGRAQKARCPSGSQISRRKLSSSRSQIDVQVGAKSKRKPDIQAEAKSKRKVRCPSRSQMCQLKSDVREEAS